MTGIFNWNVPDIAKIAFITILFRFLGVCKKFGGIATMQKHPVKVNASPSLPHQDDCKTRKDTKYCITKQGPILQVAN